MMIICINNCWY